MDSPPYLERVFWKSVNDKQKDNKHETTTTTACDRAASSAREEKAFWEQETPNNNWEDRENKLQNTVQNKQV